MMNNNFTFLTSDNLPLHGRAWSVEDPRGLICLVHGYGEHCGRYEHVATEFNKAGYTMSAFDQRGHGHSPGPRGFTPSYLQSLADIATFVDTSRHAYPHLPTIIYGHSMGGNMVLNLVLRARPDLRGAIITSPWLALTTPPSPILTAVSRLIGYIYPKYSITQPPYPGDILSRDPVFDEAFWPDPLTHGVISNTLFSGVSQAGRWALDHAAELALPTLLMHGTGDKLTSYEASEQFAGRAPAELLTYRSWPDYYHELHNDLGKEEVLTVMVDFLNQLTGDSPH